MVDNDNSISRVIPIRIADDQWPSVADAIWHERGGTHQAWLRARQNEQGACLVYGQSDIPGRAFAAGRIIAPGEDIAEAIRKVGADISAPDELIDQCVQSLEPAPF